MAVRIRISREGRTNSPFYRIGVYPSRFPRNGRCLENLGWYNPLAKEADKEFLVDVERSKHWISKGALPTPKAKVLLKKAGVFAIK